MMSLISRLILFTATCLMLVPVGAVHAQTSQEYLELIKTRCEAVKQLVDGQRRSDLVARINKGRAYQEIINQQSAFSLRLRNNKLTPDAFDRQQTAVQDGVNRFRAAYNIYDDSVADLLAIDCQTKPQDFADQLEEARNQRAAIGSEVAVVDTELARYRQEVVEFKQELERLNNTVLGESE